MRKLTTILLICTLAFQYAVKAGIFGYYLANKEYLTSVFCINRDKPEMACQGKCHLKKQLKKQDEQERKHHASTGVTETPLFFDTGSAEPLPFVSVATEPIFVSYTPVILDGPGMKVFQPPRPAFAA